jgi:metal-responsive CopG/Arc/MetJ family transcriptional regulator
MMEMEKIAITIPEDLLLDIDADRTKGERGEVPRSTYICAMLRKVVPKQKKGKDYLSAGLGLRKGK